ncbi:MAG: right-handed parallel beta-helix repeat-containing protein [Lysobacteraceae bacterium]
MRLSCESSTTRKAHKRIFRVPVTAVALLLLWPAASLAAIFQVNVTVQDAPDDNINDDLCSISASGGFCTLRAAVMQANATPGTDVITLPAGATIVLDITGNPEFLPASKGDLNVLEDLIVMYGGSNPDDYPLIDASALDDRVFTVFDGEFFLTRARITGGSRDEPGGRGGAIFIGPLATSATLTEVELFGNNATLGGAVYNDGSALSVVDSSLHNNAAVTHGGALVNHCGTATIERSSIYQNSNFGTYGESLHNVKEDAADSGECRLNVRNSSVLESSGFGILSQGGTLNLTSSTIAENLDGGIRVSADVAGETLGELRMRNSVIAENSPANCQLIGTGWNTNGYNAADDSSCDLAGGATNMVAANLYLDTASDDSNTWQRFKLPFSISPLLDAAHPVTGGVGCPEEDQRDLPRPKQGSIGGSVRCDIGSIEIQSVPVIVNADIFADGFETP